MDPTTPALTLKVGDQEIPLAWTKRSEAILSRHGHDLLSLLEAMRKRQTALYALCLGLKAGLPAARAPEAPEDIAEWLADEAGQARASSALVALLRHAYPAPAEKKSASKS
jgi:hypothetical protein